MRSSREYIASWICKFEMFWYPFDTQVCTMEFYIAFDLATLSPDKFSYNGPKNLAEFYVHNTEMCSGVIEDHPGIKVKIYLGRRLTSNVLTIFVPTIILVIISHMANEFQDNYIDVVISVNLTVLLVLATL